MNSIDIFPWNNNFNTGIIQIDEQHKRLVELLNLLASHVAFKSELPEMNSVFDQLADYTVYHFKTEEKIWHQYMPDDALDKSHHENHARFINDVLKLKQNMSDHPVDEVVEEVLSYLTRWLALHILDSDRYMAKVVLAKQSGLMLGAAKLEAEEKMKGSTRTLIDVILSVYETLSSNALALMREIGAQKQLEQQVLQTTDTLLRAQKIAHIGNWSYRVADGKIEWSQEVYAIFGRDPDKDSLNYDALISWIHPDDRDYHQQYMQKMLELTRENQNQIENLQYRLVRPDGDVRWVEATYECEFNSKLELNAFFGTVQDVTERIQSEQDLALSETRYRAFVENTMEGIYSFRAIQPIATNLPPEKQIELIYQSHIVACNDAQAQMHGYQKTSHLVGMTLCELHGGTDNPDNISFLTDWIKADYRISDITSHEIDRSGQAKYFSNSLVGQIEEGKLVSAWGSQTDITQRMQAELQLARNEAQLSLITRNVPFSIARLNTKLQYKFCNQSYADLFGLQSADLIGKHARDILGETSYSRAANYMRRVLNGEACGYELILPETSRGRREVDVQYVPELDENNKVLGFIATIIDVTEKKQRERQQELRSNIHRLLASGLPLKELLETIVLSVEKTYPEMLCSILLLDQEGEHLFLGSAPSLPDFYNIAIDGIKIGDGIGSCCTAAYTGKCVIAEDIYTHPYWENYRDLAESAGLRSCWSQPIFSQEGKVLGTFAIYHRQPNKPDSSSIDIITEAAKLIAIALERDQANQQLQIAATAFESQQGMLITDADENILRINRAFSEITGYTADDVRGETPRLLSSGRHDKVFFQQMWEQIIEQGKWEGEIWNRRKDGEIFPELLTITAVKDINGKVINYVASATDISKSKAAASQIENLAFYDPLTQLPNRRLMHDRLRQALTSSLRSGKKGALLFIDLDNFKSLNDTLGHDYGDMLLQQTAHRLKATIRENDSVARFGGDEFIVMLENLNEKALEAATQTEAIAKKILDALNQPYMLGTHEYLNSPSIGMTLFDSHEVGADEVLKQADIAMYEAKKSGRNTLQFFDPQMQAVISAHVQMEKDIRIALQEKQFQLYYQVQTNADGNTVGAEALIRWIHPEHGLISPINFIPLAEETGLIIPLGQWILETACAQLQSWQQDVRFQHLTISINISAKQFHQASFTRRVLAAIKETGIDPLHLKLELTESILVGDIEDTIAKMNTLKQSNVLFYLDDFGTGYSSLQYLRRLPLYQLKIDQSFTRDIVEDKNDEAIVRTIIAMAQNLELGVIAEGVETKEQQQALMEMGCFNYQGYYFGRPLPIDQFEQALTSALDCPDEAFDV